MKKVVSFVLSLVLCIGLSSMLSGCSQFYFFNLHPYNTEERIATAKSGFCAVMDSLNSKIAFYDVSPEIDSDTTIQQVVDMVRDYGGDYIVYNIKTDKPFLDYCELSPVGFYIIKDDAQWLEIYSG